MADQIVLAGGSGFIGAALAARLGRGREVVILTRSPDGYRGPGRAVAWDGHTVGDWHRDLEGAAAVVNLAGKNVNTRWTDEARREIERSRVDATRAIADAVGRCAQPPRVWVQASAVGYYGDRGDAVLTESAGPGPESDFLVRVCKAWEAPVEGADLPTTRKVILRIGVVLGREGGAYPLLRRITWWGAGGHVGSGRQWVPWIHLDDLVSLIVAAIDDPQFVGVVNATAPEPVANGDMMRAFRQALRRPWSPPAPAAALRLAGAVLGIPAEPALSSTRAVPARAQEAGFHFAHREIRGALLDLG